MKVLESNRFDIYIYKNDHLPPHCHIRFNDGSEIRVSLLLMVSMDGDKIERNVKRYLLNHIDVLIESWDSLHKKKEL